MSGFVNPLARRRPEGVSDRTASIKIWVRKSLALSDDTVISVNELACSEPGCPPRHTVVLVMATHAPTVQFDVHKAILDVEHGDILNALQTPKSTD